MDKTGGDGVRDLDVRGLLQSWVEELTSSCSSLAA